MAHLIGKRIEETSWIKFGLWFAALFVYSTWAFNMDSPWTRALTAAGGELPETQPGFPPIEPFRSIGALGEATSDYIIWQALDLPYAMLNLLVMTTAMGLGLKALRFDKSFLRYILILPVIYVSAELIENMCVALFASGLLPPNEPIVLIQQLATTLKFGSGVPSLVIGALGVLIAAIVELLSIVRKAT